MSIEKRRFIRFSLDIPAKRYAEKGEVVETMVQQISVGGCMLGHEEPIFPGDEFRMELTLPNKNRLPVTCKAIYKFEGRGIGIKFHEICQFEQELLAEVISSNLEKEGLPLLVDPFTQPPMFINYDEQIHSSALLARVEEELRIDNAMSQDS